MPTPAATPGRWTPITPRRSTAGQPPAAPPGPSIPYGRAIDINPLQNPYLGGGTVQPAAGSTYLTRWPLRQGVIDPVVRAAFAAAGWYWGGNWRSPTDYMHFSANNR